MTNSKVKRASQEKIPFISFCRELVLELEQNGKLNTAETYTSAISSFGHFIADGTDVTLGNLNAGIMIRYENYLAARGLCRNTTSFYMRNLRAMYNRAVEKGYVEQKMPFRHVYTGVDELTGKTLVEVDPKYFRPAEVQELLGDPSKAMKELGWNPRKTSFGDLVKIMVKHDMEYVRNVTSNIR